MTGFREAIHGHTEELDCVVSSQRRRRDQADQPGSIRSSGTAASYFELCSTSDVLTLRTCGAAVRWVTKSWNVDISGATHLRMKSTSPESIQHSRTKGSARTNSSNARKSASA